MGNSVIKKLLWGGSAIAVLFFAVMMYTSFYGNPGEYFKAKAEITGYIDKNYRDVLHLEGISYSSKMQGYIGRVTEKDDSRNKSYIGYYGNTGNIEDDYHFRTRLSMEDQLRVAIATLVSASSGIPAEKLKIDPQVEIPPFKYRMSDKYNPAEPVGLTVSIANKYASLEEFTRDAYSIIKSLYSPNLTFTKIELYSFTPEDGNKSYHIIVKEGEKISSLEDVKKLAYIKSWEKK